jgi:hypothetical protein
MWCEEIISDFHIFFCGGWIYPCYAAFFGNGKSERELSVSLLFFLKVMMHNDMILLFLIRMIRCRFCRSLSHGLILFVVSSNLVCLSVSCICVFNYNTCLQNYFPFPVFCWKAVDIAVFLYGCTSLLSSASLTNLPPNYGHVRVLSLLFIFFMCLYFKYRNWQKFFLPPILWFFLCFWKSM